MKVYLVRHGDSLPMGNDDKRPLSEQGKADIQRLATFIAPLNIQVGHFFHSEKLRAEQTATIIAENIKSQTPLEVRPELSPNAPVITIMDEIFQRDEDVILVGHMPFMGKLLSLMVAKDENIEVAIMQTGTMICLEQIEQRHWAIQWMITPSCV